MGEQTSVWVWRVCASVQLATLRPKMFGFGDLNPLKWLGKAAAETAGEGWKAAMIALWSAGLWVLELAFKLIDAFTTPDLSADGPMATTYAYTFGIGAVLASVMALVQLGLAAFRRDGTPLGRVVVGVIQFGAVWSGYTGIAATLVVSTSGLTTGLLQGLLGIDAFSGFSATDSWPEQVTDTTVATVLGVCTLFLIFPAAVAYIVVMLVREAALMLITATAPIAAAGLLHEGSRVWFWKSLRWFIAALMTAPLTALVLGIGVQATHGLVTNGPADGDDDTVVAVGMAVVGCVLIFIGALCPLVLFKLLAFVDPGTSSGVSMRAGLAAAGGVGGLLGGSAAGSAGQFSGSSAAAHSDTGRSGGESKAGAATQGRFAAALGSVVGGVNSAVLSTAQSGAAAGADTLNATGIGHQSHYLSGQGTRGTPSAADGLRGQSADGNATPGGDTRLDTPGADSAPPAPGGERTDNPAPLSGRGAQTGGGPPTTSPAGQASTPVGAPLAGAAAVSTEGVAGAGGAEAADAAAG